MATKYKYFAPVACPKDVLDVQEKLAIYFPHRGDASVWFVLANNKCIGCSVKEANRPTDIKALVHQYYTENITEVEVSINIRLDDDIMEEFSVRAQPDGIDWPKTLWDILSSRRVPIKYSFDGDRRQIIQIGTLYIMCGIDGSKLADCEDPEYVRARFYLRDLWRNLFGKKITSN